MKRPITTAFCTFLSGLLIGGGAVHLFFQKSEALQPIVVPAKAKSEPGPTDPFASADAPADPFMGTTSDKATPEPTTAVKSNEPLEVLSSLAGNWVSPDGQQFATFDYRLLHFKTTTGWPELDHKTFLIGAGMDFLAGDAYYSIAYLNSDPNAITLIRTNPASDDLSEFFLYREDDPRGRRRPPLPTAKPPPRIQAILDKIPTIGKGDLTDPVLKRMQLEESKMEVLAGHSGLGETEWTYGLGEGDEWMVHFITRLPAPDADKSLAVLQEFQIVRGHVDDARNHVWDIEEQVYPFFSGDKIVTGRSEAREAGK